MSRAVKPPPPARRAGRWKDAARGLLLGVLIGQCLTELGLGGLVHVEDYFVPAAALGGALLGVTRARSLLWPISAFLVAALAVVGYTPLVRALMPQVERRDALHPEPAIVVLSTATHKDKSMDAAGQQRILQGYALLRRGLAPRLVLTNTVVPNGSAVPAVRRQMQALGLDYPVDAVGPVFNTHDEAVAVAALARQRGWRRVILVTHLWHMRRAAAVFEKAGLPVLCAPCDETQYDLKALNTSGARLHAFRDWLHEIVGIAVYRLRGWT